MRYRVDSTWRRVGRNGSSVLAGSPLRLFRLTAAGADVADRVERGEIVHSGLIDRLLDAGAIHPLVDGPVRFGVDDITIVTPQLGGQVRRDGRITVDDGSAPSLDGATARLPVNRGPAAARNEGRRHVATALIAFIDADVDLPPDGASGAAPGDEVAAWWAPLLAHFDDPDVGLVAPRVHGDDASSLDLGDEPGRIRAGTRVSYVPAAAVLVRAEAFDDVGGFDEQLRFGEDVDFVWRLDEAGWRCRFEPSAMVSHRPRSTWRARLIQQVGYGSSSAPLALRHPNALAPIRTNGWTAAAWSLAGIGHPVVAFGVAASGIAVVARKLPDAAPKVAVEIAIRSQLRAGIQIGQAVRRAWWPIVGLAAVFSRRARWVGAVAAIASPRRVLLDGAFGWGMWAGMLRHRTWTPVVPGRSGS